MFTKLTYLMGENTQFLKALLSGNTTVIQQIYKRNFPKVKRFVLKNKGQQQDAEDIFQKVLIQMAVRYQKEKFEIKTSFEAYLFTACKNLWRRELNKQKNRVTDCLHIELVDDSKDMALALVEQQRWELFYESLEQLSENCQKILKLFFAKVSYAAIVKKMNYNSETVARQRVFKCKKKLTEQIKQNKKFKSLTQL